MTWMVLSETSTDMTIFRRGCAAAAACGIREEDTVNVVGWMVMLRMCG